MTNGTVVYNVLHNIIHIYTYVMVSYNQYINSCILYNKSAYANQMYVK